MTVTYEDKYFLALRPPVKGRLPEAENKILWKKSFLDYCGLPQEINQSIVFNLKDGEDKLQYINDYFNAQGFRGTSTKYLFLIALLLIAACSIVLYSLYYISVSEKLKEYGRLKVIGTTSKQFKIRTGLDGFHA